MPQYQAPLNEIRFVLHEVLQAEPALAALMRPGDEEPLTADLMDAILSEAAKLAETVLAPLNQSGDAEGCRWDNGAVRTPAGFRDAYRRFVDGGWPGLVADPTYGGQGLPQLINTVFEEMMSAANLSFSTYPGLTLGAYNALARHGSESLKAAWLPWLADGSWAGTMCLTEPQCGTDLGLIRTRAVPQPDGSLRVTGTKIFITAGEHDLTENILHLVLARLPDAPAGTRGISLVLVPKRLPAADGGAGPRNGVTCSGIEHKMGLQASSTCTLVFEDAVGWLVGAPHKGMRAMFTMMNAARLAVGLQGLGIAEAALQAARAHARERLQGRALSGARRPDLPADPIVAHPDVRRMLLTIRATLEPARVLAYRLGLALDRQERAQDPAERAAAADLVALLTPVAKALLTDLGVEAANLAVQVHGGAGYIRDVGVEQYVRDARITQIYEGTNGIQALDLVGRKLPQDAGRLLRRFFHPAEASLAAVQADPDLAPLAEPLAKAFGRLQQVTVLIATRGLADPDEAAAAATEYLRLFGLVALGLEWLAMAGAATRGLRGGGGTGNAALYRTKLKTARFYMTRILPQVHGLAAVLAAGAGPITAFADEEV